MLVISAAEIVDVLEEELLSLASGAAIPGEHELADRFAVPRTTVRTALAELERRSVVRRVGTGGSFRRGRVDYVIEAGLSPSFSATVAAAGARPGASLLMCRTRRAVDAERRWLDLSNGSRVWEVTRVLSVNDEPAGYSTSALAYRAFPGLDRAVSQGGSLAAMLRQRYGVQLARLSYRISLSTPGESVADALTHGDRSPVWLAESVNRLRGGPPVEYSRTYLRPDVLNVVFEIKENQ